MSSVSVPTLAALGTLFGSASLGKDEDSKLYDQLLSAMVCIRLLEVHCFFGSQISPISFVVPPDEEELFGSDAIESLALQARNHWKGNASRTSKKFLPLILDGKYLGIKAKGIAVRLPFETPYSDQPSVEQGRLAREYDLVIGIYKCKPARRNQKGSVRRDKLLSLDEERHVQEMALSVLPTLYEVVRHRMRRFSEFPDIVSARYLNDARPMHGDRAKLKPPWASESRRTATLSFDLRKSTVCMEQADSPKAFAEFLSWMTILLTRIAHQHGGVFDKFTGDGCLVHFLDAEQRFFNEATGRNSKANVVTGDKMIVQAALECAIDMQLASRWLLSELRPNLRLDSKLFGAGIGIDIADTFWNVDRSSNPVVVGRGVVGACRLGSFAKKNEIYVTNVAYFRLSIDERKRFGKATITGKNMHAEEKFEAWRYRPGTNADMLARQLEIDRLCDEVKKRGYVGF